ncbi:MAG: hypothetical protein FRX48_03509 [Lasallia pustulata]|uniref:Mitochondrial adapter protein MCP1 transmembrane domain-containing protein n=1 Tax=Lasallia pustulata TaxID=136370 RepID=A0A5M8PSH3_9LECA|nr:MAG: hypothetical protein FRX48_03509 [Lasallia pustulata]
MQGALGKGNPSQAPCTTTNSQTWPTTAHPPHRAPTPSPSTSSTLPPSTNLPPSSQKTHTSPPRAPSPPSRSSALGLSNHNPTWWLTRIQRYTSYTFTLFATAHLTTTSLLPLLLRSLPTSEPYLLLTRPYYQSPLLEPLLVGLPLLAHISSGLALRLYRRAQAAKRYGAESHADRRRLAWPKLSGTSALGYVLVPLVVGHAAVTRGLPLWVEGGSSGVGLGYLAHGFARFPGVAFAWHAALVGVGAWHFVWGWGKWMGWTPDMVGRGERRERRWWVVNGVSGLVAGLWMLGVWGCGREGGWGMGWEGLG